jgi:hypothetical protein
MTMGFPEPLDRYGGYQLFTIDEFRQMVSTLGPGTGYYGTTTHESDEPVDPANIYTPTRFTHVVWYANKSDAEVLPSWWT